MRVTFPLVLLTGRLVFYVCSRVPTGDALESRQRMHRMQPETTFAESDDSYQSQYLHDRYDEGESTGKPRPGRNMQASPNESSLFQWRVNYTAHFQLIQDTTCDGPSPIIRVYCRQGNTGSIQVHSTSDPSIVCRSSPQIETSTGWVYLECDNTCDANASPTAAASSSPCRSVYLQVDSSIELGPFGKIDFSCSGNSSTELEAAVAFADSGNGTCGTSASGLTRNLHILRMGVSCPTTSGSASNSRNSGSLGQMTTTLAPPSTSERTIVFDDSYFECTPSTSSYPYGDNFYTCLVGASCNGVPCEVDFEPVLIWTNALLFDMCVEAIVFSDESILPVMEQKAPTLSPGTVTTLLPANYTSRFVASWGILFEPTTAATCAGSIPTVQVECLYSDIHWTRDSDLSNTDLNCTLVNPRVMSCFNGNRDSFVDQFTSVNYSCTGSVVPQTQVGIVENIAYCDGNSLEGTVTHALQLGIICGIGTDQEFLFSGDLFLDCINVTPHFGYLDPFGSTVVSIASRYTCSESVVFASKSTRNQTLTIPNLFMSTDITWATTPDGTCYQVIPVPSVAVVIPSGPVPPTPTVSPPVPSSSSSESKPSPLFIAFPVQAATLRPVPTSTYTTTIGESTDSIIFGISTIAFAGITSGTGVVLIVVLTFWFARRRTRHDRPNRQNPTALGRKTNMLMTLRDLSATGPDSSWTESHTENRDAEFWVTGGNVGTANDLSLRGGLHDVDELLQRKGRLDEVPAQRDRIEANALFQVIRLAI